MASNIDITGLALNPLEVGDLGAFIVERTFEDPTLRSIHAVWTGVKMKEQIAFASQLSKTGIKDSSCTRPNSGAKSIMTQKYWEPVKIGDTLVHCQADVNALFKAYFAKVQNYAQLFDITGTDLEQFLGVLLTEAAMKAVFRLVWLGDTDVEEATATGGETAVVAGVVDADLVAFYDAIDGLWKQIFTAVTAGTIKKSTVVLSALNAESTTTLQTTLTAGDAVLVFEDMWRLADTRLRSDANAQFLVSREIFENYRQYLQTKGENFTIDYTKDGLPSLKWNGKLIVNMETIWDLNLRADFVADLDDNLYILPNRAVLTVPANIPVATLNDNDMSELDVWYEKKERQMYTAYGFTLDAKVLEEYMIVVAY